MIPTLYSFRRCPYAMRGRMAIHAAGIKVEHREILLRDKPQPMLDVSPKGTVPVVVLADGTVIDESLDVMIWALSQNDPLSWLRQDCEDMDAIIAQNDTDFKHHLDRYKYASRYEETAKRGDTNPEHKRQAEKFLEALERRLERAPYLLGTSQSLADIAIFPFIRQFANVDREDWLNNSVPKTRDWLERHLNSDLFKAVMVKHALWLDPAAELLK